jgi:hypothetical protein
MTWENRSPSGILLLSTVNGVRTSRDGTSRWNTPETALAGGMLMEAVLSGLVGSNTANLRESVS